MQVEGLRVNVFTFKEIVPLVGERYTLLSKKY